MYKKGIMLPGSQQLTPTLKSQEMTKNVAGNWDVLLSTFLLLEIEMFLNRVMANCGEMLAVVELLVL